MFLLDTDTVIYTLKGNESVIENLANHQHDVLKISVISLMELYYGAHKSMKTNANIAKVRRLEDAFETISVNFFITETFGMIKAQLERHGTPLDNFDLIIAATALAHNLILVSNNEKHFRRVDGLKLENWNRPVSS
jgi:tRNA(fMet)-specific endonuclease VapC